MREAGGGGSWLVGRARSSHCACEWAQAGEVGIARTSSSCGRQREVIRENHNGIEQREEKLQGNAQSGR